MRADGWRWLERALLLIGVVSLSWYGYVRIEAAQYQREQAAAFARVLESTPVSVAPPEPATHAGVAAPHAPEATASPATDASPEPSESSATDASSRRGVPSPSPSAFPAKRPPLNLPDPSMIGLLEIPRLRLSTVVASGDDAATLKVAAGHLPDTPRPWEPGNSAIAAHRDGLFRPLKHIRVGDEIRMRTTRGEFAYTVRDIRIVKPTDLSVLEPADRDSLTLITCYPFNYIGAAPNRYIVRAERVGDSNDRVR